ncbi:PadR family transcriptional regulator, partial [Mesorhizobium japonicum]|uniref:PadR family transcriptional regulator n=1 Tax=Mesorhizobium japonicum TaxID=2066070 RepID=UPI003B5BEE97
MYPTLQQLVDEGFVVQPSGAGKGEYELTDEGRAYVTEHQDEVDGVFSQPSGRDAVARGDRHEGWSQRPLP